MLSFIGDMNPLSPTQYGVRKAHPTQHAILQDIVNGMRTNSDYSHVVFLLT